MSERIVLSQKAYILFYIKSPTNGHAVPAELAQHAQQLSKGLNSLQAAAVKGHSPANGPSAKGPSASHSKQSAAPPPVSGPAQRPATGLLAATQLHDELLAPVAEAPHMLKAGSKQKAATPAAETGTHAISQTTGSTDQLLISNSQGRAVSSSPSANHQQAAGQVQATSGGHEQIKQSTKRKADVLGNAKRPSMMQKMSASGIDAVADAEADAEQASKRKKLSTGQPAVAAERVSAVEQPSGGAVPSGGLTNGIEHSVRLPVSAEHAALHADAQSAGQRNASHGADAAPRYVSKQSLMTAYSCACSKPSTGTQGCD